ncbi:hypothetical protein [Sphaerisporangium sp. NPDC051011]|uniref:hypothetical protein n=1 Tax=Sphaerisporangium sp. NPDC051011 TaxID=3155792 RepID=UPI0033CF9029
MMWLGRVRVVTLGYRAAHLSPPVLKAFLYHHLRQTTGFMNGWTVVQNGLAVAGWWVAGFLPLPFGVAVMGLVAVMPVMGFGNTLVCDVAAVRAAGRDANLAVMKIARSMRAGQSIQDHLWTVAMALLAPPPMPLGLRVGVVRAAGLLWRGPRVAE